MSGARDTADLYQDYAGARANIANSAVDAANSLKSTVDNAKTNLYGLAEQAVNPLQMAQDAQGSASAIVAPQSYPTLGNVFSDALGPVAGAVKTQSQATNQYAPSNGLAPIGGQGSAAYSQ
jgi:hypothetical protein